MNRAIKDMQMKYFTGKLFNIMITTGKKRIMLLPPAMLLFVAGAFAQINGDVVDQKGLGIPDAIITATEAISKVIDTVRCDTRGFYEFNGLKPGTYRIEARAAGFKPTIIDNIIVKEGDTGAVKGEEDMYRGQRLNITMTRATGPG